MIKCKICGVEKQCRLSDHIKKIHNMKLDDYYEKYGQYVSNEYIEKMSEVNKKIWSTPGFKDKMSLVRKEQFTEEVLKKKSDSAKEFYKNGGKVWNTGLTKETNESVKSIGEKNSKLFTGRTKENYEYLRKHSEYMKENTWYIQYNKDRKNIPELNKKWKESLSLWYVNNLDKQKHPYNGFKTGWYNGKNGKFWYQSSWEKEFMEFLDTIDDIKWTNKHGIKIKYTDGIIDRYYIPDFYITRNNIFIILELKGWIRENTQLKIDAAIDIYNDKYKIFYNVNDAKEFINEFCKD